MLDLSGYKLTFDDEFNARSISKAAGMTTWGDIRPEWKMGDNADIGFGHSSFVDPASGYDPFKVSGGALTITAAGDVTSAGYPGSMESGLITTQGGFLQRYGYFETRADLSNARGGWDAFWMEPNHMKADPNNAGGWQELDVVEHYADNDRGVYSTIHTTDPQNGVRWQDNRQVYSEVAIASGYHTYGVNWQADRISFYVDGNLVGSQATPSDMHDPMYLMVNLATRDGATTDGQRMTIDYIRAYSNDPNAKAVVQDTVSAPDGHDPGLYGATATPLSSLQAVTAAATTIHGSHAADTLYGDQGDDCLYGGMGDDHLYGKLGVDVVYGNQGADFIYGNQGDDALYGGQGDDVAFGGQGNDVVYGNLSNDIVYGNMGNDLLFGGQGSDVLYGGQGDDILVGGVGSNVLVGGLGADCYVFGANPGARDLVLGLSQSKGDRLSLGGQTYTLSTAQNGDALLTLSRGGTIDLAGVKAEQVNASFFA